MARYARWFLAIAGTAAVLAFFVELVLVNSHPSDTVTYLAAGERLNAGHELYALSPGDRVMTFRPPYAEVPLLSPPLIGVVFRPLAALPNELGAYAWRDLFAVALAAVLIAMLRRRPTSTGVGLLVLSLPIAYQLILGNLEGPLVVGSVAAWLLLRRGSSVAAGALLGVMVVLKLTPIPLAWWAVLVGGRRALLGVVLAVAGSVLVGIAGSSLGANVAYLDVIRHTQAVGTTEWSLAGFGRLVGVPADLARWFPSLFAIAAMGASWLLRDRPGASFVAAVLGSVLGSPVVYFLTVTRLITVLVPSAWPWNDGHHRTDSGGFGRWLVS